MLASPVVITQEVQTHSSNAPAPIPTLSPEQSTALNEEEEPQLGPGPNTNVVTEGGSLPSVPLHALQKLDNIPGLITRPSAPVEEQEGARSSASSAASRAESSSRPRARFSEAVTPQSGQQDEGATPSHRSIFRAATMNMGFLPRLRRRNTSSGRSFWEPTRRSQKALQWDLARSIPLKDLLPMLTGVQRSFFQKLDMELDKVESFYVEREKEMNLRCASIFA